MRARAETIGGCPALADLEICVGVGQIGPSGKKRTGAAHPQTHQLLQTDAEAIRRKRSSRPQYPVSWRI